MPPATASPGQFPDTRWSLVLEIQRSGPDSAAAELALEEICRNYWLPVYVFIRREGNGETDAEDLTQGFFEHLLRGPFFKNSNRDQGRLRNYLLRALKNFLHGEHRKQTRLKRGGGEALLSIDRELAEGMAMAEVLPSGDLPPDASFERRWAEDLLARAMRRLREHYEERDKADFFKELSPMLSEMESGAVSQAGQLLGLSDNAVRIAFHRMKRRFQDLVRDEARMTIEPGGDVDEELRYLASLLS